MKTLLIGFIAFFVWSVFSTYVYVCEIRGLCNEQVAMQTAGLSTADKDLINNKSKVLQFEQAALPDDQTIYFAFDKSDFNANGSIDSYIDISSKYLNQNNLSKIIVTGHADAIGTEEYNMALGFRRAQSIQLYIESKGIIANKIIIESKGESNAADDNSTSEGRANNRRSIITIKK